MDWAGITIGIICALPSLLGGIVGCIVLLWIDHCEQEDK